MLPRNYRQEGLSLAYVRAVAAQAGCVCSQPERDFGIDLYLREITQTDREYRDLGGEMVDVQLRSTTLADITDDSVVYDIDVRTYNLLRHPGLPPLRILVVLVLPESEREWLAQSVDEMILRKCAWWHSLRGAPGTASTSTTRIRIPKTQIFTPEAVHNLFQLIRENRTNG